MKITKTKPKYMRFKHVNGFSDETQYLEARRDGIWIKCRGKSAYKSKCYSLKECNQFVKRGVWKEI